MLYVVNLIRSIAFVIDKILFWAFEFMYETFIMVAEFQFGSTAETSTSQETLINGLYGRLYAIIWIVMAVIISVSVVRYIADPSKFSDSKNGMMAIVKNIFIAVAGVILVPFVFRQLAYIQGEVITTIPQIVFGQPINESAEDPFGSGEVSREIFSAYFFPNKGMSESDIEQAQAALDDVIKGCSGQELEGACKSGINIYEPFLEEQTKIDDEKVFKYDYMFFFTGISALFGAYVFLLSALDSAVRIFKLYFLQLIAPIALFSNVISKNTLSNWIKEVRDTYLQVFIRLGIVYFGVYMIQLTIREFSAGEDVSTFLYVFLIYGIFTFMLMAPKLIGQIFNISTTFDLSLSNRFAGSKYIPRPLQQAVGLGAGAAAGAVGGLAATAGSAVLAKGSKTSLAFTEKFSPDKTDLIEKKRNNATYRTNRASATRGNYLNNITRSATAVAGSDKPLSLGNAVRTGFDMPNTGYTSAKTRRANDRETAYNDKIYSSANLMTPKEISKTRKDIAGIKQTLNFELQSLTTYNNQAAGSMTALSATTEELNSMRGNQEISDNQAEISDLENKMRPMKEAAEKVRNNEALTTVDEMNAYRDYTDHYTDYQNRLNAAKAQEKSYADKLKTALKASGEFQNFVEQADPDNPDSPANDEYNSFLDLSLSEKMSKIEKQIVEKTSEYGKNRVKNNAQINDIQSYLRSLDNDDVEVNRAVFVDDFDAHGNKVSVFSQQATLENRGNQKTINTTKYVNEQEECGNKLVNSNKK